jgi:hypothetical protein
MVFKAGPIYSQQQSIQQAGEERTIGILIYFLVDFL